MAASTNPVREALLRRTLTIGSWIQIGHPASAEVLAGAGFDWIAVDCEHTDIGLESLGSVLRGLHGRDTIPLVRVRENATLAIRQALDLGARGVIVPLVGSAAEAERAVRSAKYPPRGERGFAFCRANEHGADFAASVRRANADVAVVVMIESREGVEQIDAILAVDGVDGVFIGPYDLSGSLGVPGQVDHPRVRAACRRVLTACQARKKSAGMHLVTPTRAAVRRAVKQGFTFLALGIDTVFIAQAARQAMDAARA